MPDDNATVKALAAAVREFALGLPEAYEDFPWGERVIKVNKKIFVFLVEDSALELGGRGLTMGVKLPMSANAVLQLPYTKPSGYNLGKSGWVTVTCLADILPQSELLECWIEESYRAIAPKKLVTQLESQLAQTQTQPQEIKP